MFKIFISRTKNRNLKQITKEEIESFVYLLIQKSGEISKFHPWAIGHTLRLSFVTHCIKNNVNILHVQKMRGH